MIMVWGLGFGVKGVRRQVREDPEQLVIQCKLFEKLSISLKRVIKGTVVGVLRGILGV